MCAGTSSQGLTFYRFLVAFLLTLILPLRALSSDAKPQADAQALIDRAEKISSLSGAGAVPFFVELQYQHAPTRASGDGGTYKLWWAAHDKWRAQAQSGDLTEIEVRNEQGLWIREDTDRRMDAILSGARVFPFSGQLLNWGERVTGVKEAKINGTKVPCLQTENAREHRELCFDPQTGVLLRTRGLTPITTSSMQRQLAPGELVTEYRDYTALGDRLLPREIRAYSEGRPEMAIRLIHVTLYPKAPFPDIFFTVPDGYHMWPGCDQYKPPETRTTFLRDFSNNMGSSPLLGASNIPGGVRIIVGADGKAQQVQLINPGHNPPARFQSSFMGQTYEPAICDGKPVAGMLFVDFVP